MRIEAIARAMRQAAARCRHVAESARDPVAVRHDAKGTADRGQDELQAVAIVIRPGGLRIEGAAAMIEYEFAHETNELLLLALAHGPCAACLHWLCR